MDQFPPWLEREVEILPLHLSRHAAAEDVTRLLFPTTHKTLEDWPLRVRHVNGKAIYETRQLFEFAFAKFAASPVVIGGRQARTAGRARDPEQPAA